jgi:hypothetical protein
MKIGHKTTSFGRNIAMMARRAFFTLGALVLFIRDELVRDVQDIVLSGRLFLGITSLLVGLLSFASDKYCDGNAANYYTCTRPATYYFYPWWAILLIVIGSFLIVLWFLRRQRS